MNYHIGNMLIYQEFVPGNDCPLCRIRNIQEKRLAEQYLNESVMDDFQRRMVNEKGFCLHHTQMLLARPEQAFGGVAAHHPPDGAERQTGDHRRPQARGKDGGDLSALQGYLRDLRRGGM